MSHLTVSMVEAIKEIVCNHCKKPIKKEVKLIGLTAICPYCKKPSENIDKKMG